MCVAFILPEYNFVSNDFSIHLYKNILKDSNHSKLYAR